MEQKLTYKKHLGYGLYYYIVLTSHLLLETFIKTIKSSKFENFTCSLAVHVALKLIF